MSRKTIITIAAAGFFSPLNTSPPVSVFGSSAANGGHGAGGSEAALSPAAAHAGNDYPTLVTLGNPSMGIILVVLLCTFLFMGFFTYYVRRYAELQGEMMNTLHRQPAAGLDPAAMAKLPLVTFSAQGKGGGGGCSKAENCGGDGQSECVVCLTDFEDMETLKLLPRCHHRFHPDCIDMWLYSHSTCPLCRRSLLPDKGSSKGKASARVVDEQQQQEQIAVIVSSATLAPGGSHGSTEDQQEARGREQEQAVIRKEDMRPYNWRSHSTGHSIAPLPPAAGRGMPPLPPLPPHDDIEIGLAPNRRENPLRIVIFPRQAKATEGGEQASSSSSSSSFRDGLHIHVPYCTN